MLGIDNTDVMSHARVAGVVKLLVPNGGIEIVRENQDFS